MSATVPIACPKCGHSGQVPESFVGRTIHCKHCDQHFPVTPPQPPPAVGDDIELAPLSDEDERHARERFNARVYCKDRPELHPEEHDAFGKLGKH